MKAKEYKKLKKEIDNQSFSESYKSLNTVLKYLSILGNFGSIFLASFFISELFKKSVTVLESDIAVWIITLTLLGALELIKRFVFDKFSLNFIKVKNIFTKNVFPLAIFSISIIGMSFYSSLNGAKEFTSKSDIIEQETDLNIKEYKDSIYNNYQVRVDELEEDIRFYKTSIREKDAEQAVINKSLQERGYLYRSERERNNQLINEKNDLEEKILRYEDRLKEVISDRNLEITTYEETMLSKSDSKKEENKSNSIVFIFISTTIEFLILIGIYFNKFYLFKSYRDMRKKINEDPNYQLWYLYSEVLEVLYMNEDEYNQGSMIKLPSSRELWDICRMQDLPLTRSEFDNSLKLFNSLKISKTKGSSRYLFKTREEAENILSSHFNVD